MGVRRRKVRDRSRRRGKKRKGSRIVEKEERGKVKERKYESLLYLMDTTRKRKVRNEIT